LLLFRRAPRSDAVWRGRTAWSLVAILLAFTLISGKQAHYLIPAHPALAVSTSIARRVRFC